MTAEKQNVWLWVAVIVLSFTVLHLYSRKSEEEQSADLFAGAVRSLRHGVEEAEKEVERFSYDNWRDVVPRVRDAVRLMRVQLDELDHEIERHASEAAERQDSGRY